MFCAERLTAAIDPPCQEGVTTPFGGDCQHDPVPNQPKTPTRTLRIPDELWDLAKAKARAQNTTISEKARELLTEWVYEDDED